MNDTPNFRHELKYQINYGKYSALKNRIKPIMTLDKYAKETGGYKIQSIYFDNYDDKALREKLSDCVFIFCEKLSNTLKTVNKITIYFLIACY